MATQSVVVGSIGVALLLLAFFLNLFVRLPQNGKPYALINFVGAALSCYASILIDYVPFIILEGAWAIVALVGLLRRSEK